MQIYDSHKQPVSRTLQPTSHRHTASLETILLQKQASSVVQRALTELQKKILKAIINHFTFEIPSDNDLVFYEAELRAGRTPQIGNHYKKLCIDKNEKVSVHDYRPAGTGMMGRVGPDIPVPLHLRMLQGGMRPYTGAVNTYGGTTITSQDLPRPGTRHTDQSKAMGGSAFGFTGIQGDEHLHAVGYQLGGTTSSSNMVPGPHNLNTAMLPIENTIASLVKEGYKVTYTVRFYTSEATLVNPHGRVFAADITVTTPGITHTWTIHAQEGVPDFKIAKANMDEIVASIQAFVTRVRLKVPTPTFSFPSSGPSGPPPPPPSGGFAFPPPIVSL